MDEPEKSGVDSAFRAFPAATVGDATTINTLDHTAEDSSPFVVQRLSSAEELVAHLRMKAQQDPTLGIDLTKLDELERLISVARTKTVGPTPEAQEALNMAVAQVEYARDAVRQTEESKVNAKEAQEIQQTAMTALTGPVLLAQWASDPNQGKTPEEIAQEEFARKEAEYRAAQAVALGLSAEVAGSVPFMGNMMTLARSSPSGDFSALLSDARTPPALQLVAKGTPARDGSEWGMGA